MKMEFWQSFFFSKCNSMFLPLPCDLLGTLPSKHMGYRDSSVNWSQGSPRWNKSCWQADKQPCFFTWKPNFSSNSWSPLPLLGSNQLICKLLLNSSKEVWLQARACCIRDSPEMMHAVLHAVEMMGFLVGWGERHNARRFRKGKSEDRVLPALAVGETAVPFTFSITFDRKPEKNGRRHEPGRLFPTMAANRSNRSHPTKSAAIRNLMFQALCESRIAGVNCLGSKARAGADFFPLFFRHPKTCCRKLHRQWLAMLLDQCLELGLHQTS